MVVSFDRADADVIALRATIGSHAGILGTAKLLALDPSLIRTDKLADSDPDNGVRGDPRRATAAYGRVGLELKIEAAVAQIRELMAAPQR